MQRIIQDKRHELALYIQRMKGVSPLEKLNSGYSYVSDESGRNIRSVTQTAPGSMLSIQVRDGKIGALVQYLERTEE